MGVWHLSKNGSAHPLDDLSVLNQFAAAPFPPGYPANFRRFFSPIDDVPGALRYVIGAAQRSLTICVYGFDDDALADIIKQKLEAENVAVSLTLDSSQAGGVHERVLLAREDYPNSIIAIGRSERGAIIHDKLAVVDGVIAVTGSTNWSVGGETAQDNECSVSADPVDSAVVSARILAIHNNVLQKAK